MDGTPVISCTYRPNLSAYDAFFATWLKRSLFTRQRLVVCLVTGLAMAVICMGPILPQIVKGSHGATLFWASTVFCVIALVTGVIMAAIFVYAASPLLTYLLQAAAFMVTANSRPQRTIEISDTGISKSTGDSNSWSSIHEVVDTRSTVLIFTNRNCAVMIPKSAFATPSEAEMFATSAMTHWQATKSVF